jgi:enoyl-CoA hydratase/carnithine racemase
MDVANMCDIRVASDRARFGMTYVRMGLVPGDGGAYFLPRIVGFAKACELIWSGEIIDATEALRIGLVSYVFPHAELEEKTHALVAKFTKMAPVAVQLAKHCLYRGMELDLPHTLEYLESAQLIARSTEDAKEGPRAWIEKREPIFQGR